MNTDQRFDFSYLLLCPFFAVAIIPWFKYRIQLRAVLPIMLLWLVFAMVSKRHLTLPREGRKYFTGVLLFLCVYHGLGLIGLPFGLGDGMAYVDLVDLLVSLFAFLVFHYSIRNGRLLELRFSVIFAYLCLAIAAGMTIRGEAVIEGGSRMLTGSGALDDMDAAKSAGIGSYGLVYAMGLFFFPLIYYAGFVKIPLRPLCFCCAGLIVIAVYRAGYSILIIGMSFAGMLYLLIKMGIRLRQLKYVGIVGIILLFSSILQPKLFSFTAELFKWMANHVDRYEYRFRLEELAEAASGGTESYAVMRSERYWRSWYTFLKNPFFGMGKYDWEGGSSQKMSNVGGHSLIFDTLAYYGIFGFSILILFFVFHYHYLRILSAMALDNRWWPGYYVFMFPVSMIALVNPLGGYLFYFVILFLVPASACIFKQSFKGVTQVLPGHQRNTKKIGLNITI